MDAIITPRLTSVGPRGYIRAHDDHARIIGFGDTCFEVREIPRVLAVETVRTHHYSRRVVNNSYIHLGVFLHGEFAGVLQFGYAMNPASGKSVVTGTGNREYLELNRMWLSDAMPRNGESMAIAFALRYVRAVYPAVQWVQSFADERCGCLGVVYQACNFLYCGSHKTTFYLLDGEWYHDMLLTAYRKGGNRGKYLRQHLGRAEKHVFRQFRYLYFLRRGARQRLRLRVRPYPKPGKVMAS